MRERRSRESRDKGGRLSVRRVGVTAALGLLVIAGFMIVLQASIGGAFRTKRPQLALAWMPYDAQARAKLAAQLAAISNSPEAREAAFHLATDAVRRDPIVPVAVRVLAMAQDREDPGSQNRAFALVQHAQRLSRRDQLSQIWLIQHYLEQGQFARVIPHVDIALRSSWSAQQTLFPLLASAIEDDRMLDPLLARLHQKPDWGVPFLAYLAAFGGDLGRTTRLSLALLDPHEPTERQVIDTLLQRLVDTGEYELAWEAYTDFGLAREGRQTGGLIDGGFDGAQTVPPFGWILADDPNLFASPARDPQGNGNVLTLTASAGRSGEAARQLLRLPPGRYRLRARVGSVPEDPFERPEIRVKCASGSQESVLVGVKPATRGSAAQRIEQQFSIPATCRFQWLAVALAGSDAANADTPWVDDIQLSRIAD